MPGFWNFVFIATVSGVLLASCSADQRLSLLPDRSGAKQENVPTIVSGPTFVTWSYGPSVDSDEDGKKDTYGPSDIVEIAVAFNKQVCGLGVLKLVLRTGDGPAVSRSAKYCSCGPSTVSFCYRVKRGDRDGDGLAIPANAILLRTYDGIIPDSRHPPVRSQPRRRVDGDLPDITRPSLHGAPSISSNPSDGKTYWRGEKIRISADFAEFVVVDVTGGWPPLGLKIGDTLRHALYVGDRANNDRGTVHFSEESRLVEFEYTVRKGDRDRDGTVWVPANGLSIPQGSSIRDLAGNNASVGWSVSSGRNVYIDGG